MPTLPSRWDPCPMIPDGLTSKRNYIRNLKTDQALEEITCSFNAGRLVYMQHVRFAIGGTNKFPPEWQDSPKAIQSTWGAHTVTPENPGIPEWAALSTPNALVYRFESKVVTLEYAVGRIARLACSSWNASSANELLRWAEQIIPGAKRIEHPFLPPIGGSSTGRYALPELDEDSDAEFDRRRLNEDSDTVSNPSDAE
ncbi:hypothetical protein K438DRAFT_1952929 [Mycena galopus ATCC 62051]|nr:hypothetical protein K438DRAFT_1952929 [Mycena galopus ATCC 62051]